jgi:hypothetical protein
LITVKKDTFERNNSFYRAGWGLVFVYIEKKKAYFVFSNEYTIVWVFIVGGGGGGLSPPEI